MEYRQLEILGYTQWSHKKPPMEELPQLLAYMYKALKADLNTTNCPPALISLRKYAKRMRLKVRTDRRLRASTHLRIPGVAMRTSASPHGNGQAGSQARVLSARQCARSLAAGGSVRGARTHAL
ncbi:unnamed protein product [Pieris macdunnoughi]|uniref:Uncharacterized protein n=1 Tax=Pieris macdunnoughi TaxID=345717 RepID=A0A821X185_9NEOP|nr:unnamed protein product [Pieris macdunnoughi]